MAPKLQLERIPNHREKVEDGRIYRIPRENDARLWSVTTTLKVLNKPAVNESRVTKGREVADKERDEAAAIGTAIHNAVRQIVEGKIFGGFEWAALGIPTESDERVRNGVRAFMVFQKELKFTPMTPELFVYSMLYDIAGTLDLPAMWKRKLIIMDFKSSPFLYPETWFQLAAYAMAFTDCYEMKVDEIWRVRLDRGVSDVRSARFEQDSRSGSQITEAFEGFLGLQAAAKYLYSEGARYW